MPITAAIRTKIQFFVFVYIKMIVAIRINAADIIPDFRSKGIILLIGSINKISKKENTVSIAAENWLSVKEEIKVPTEM